MKKIVCLIEDLSPGGAERQLVYLASELKKKGHDVQVWTYYPDTFYLPLLKEVGVEYLYFPEAEDKKRRAFILRNNLKKFNPDTVIAYLDTACMMACVIKAIGARFKLLVSERNTTQCLSKKEKLKFFLYRFADYIVPNSKTQSDFISIKYPYLRRKIRTITNYVDTDKFKPLNLAVSHDGINLMVAGRIVPQKNPMALMQAIRILRDEGIKIDVTWYGNSYDDKFTLECYTCLKSLDIEESFLFKPSVANIESIYPKYDAFCLPSIYEGFSNVLCEAMSCGLPIICSRVADNPFIAQENENAFFFNPYSVEDIVNSIRKFALLGDIERHKMGVMSRSLALKKFSKEKFVESYLSVFENEE